MRDFDPQIFRAYSTSGFMWEFKRDDAGTDLGEAVSLAWQREFSEPLDFASLPEPYDLGAGDLLYALPQGRFLFVNSPATPDQPRFSSIAEIRMTMPFYFLHNEHGKTISTFNARDRLAALTRLTTDILPKLPSPPLVWQLYERKRPDAEAEIILEEKGK